MPQMYLRELPCCGLYTVMVNNQPTDCCGLAFGGSPGPLETHLADTTPTCRDCNHSELGRAREPQLASQESRELAHSKAGRLTSSGLREGLDQRLSLSVSPFPMTDSWRCSLQMSPTGRAGWLLKCEQ